MTTYKVIIPIGLKPYPAQYEVSAAYLLAKYFKANIEFICRSNQKTPDFLINKVAWEMKSPTGKGKKNIQHQLQNGLKQSQNIIFDSRRSKIHISKIRNELTKQLILTPSIKRLILIEKDRTVIELLR